MHIINFFYNILSSWFCYTLLSDVRNAMTFYEFVKEIENRIFRLSSIDDNLSVEKYGGYEYVSMQYMFSLFEIDQKVFGYSDLIEVVNSSSTKDIESLFLNEMKITIFLESWIFQCQKRKIANLEFYHFIKDGRVLAYNKLTEFFLNEINADIKSLEKILAIYKNIDLNEEALKLSEQNLNSEIQYLHCIKNSGMYEKYPLFHELLNGFKTEDFISIIQSDNTDNLNITIAALKEVGFKKDIEILKLNRDLDPYKEKPLPSLVTNKEHLIVLLDHCKKMLEEYDLKVKIEPILKNKLSYSKNIKNLHKLTATSIINSAITDHRILGSYKTWEPFFTNNYSTIVEITGETPKKKIDVLFVLNKHRDKIDDLYKILDKKVTLLKKYT